MKELLRKIKTRKGQSIVEISLITPLLLLALAVPADFGAAFLAGNLVNTAAREGARIGSQVGKSGGVDTDRNFTATEANAVKNAVVAKMPGYLSNRSVTVKFYEGTPVGCMETIEVTASGDYSYLFKQIVHLFGTTVLSKDTITRTAQFAYRYQPYTNATRCTAKSVEQTYTNL